MIERDGQDGKVPSDALIEERRRLVDYRRVRLDPAAHTVFLERPGRGIGSFASVPLSDASFSTGGDHEHFFLAGGARYHHIIDPSTGRPATASRSVTARCADAYTADAVTKPVFILGPEKGMAFAARYGCEVVIVDAKNQVHVSPALARTLTFEQPTP